MVFSEPKVEFVPLSTHDIVTASMSYSLCQRKKIEDLDLTGYCAMWSQEEGYEDYYTMTESQFIGLFGDD